MSYTIAVAGKGGSGKTTLAALTLYHLLKAGRTPVLAVDADPNATVDGATNYLPYRDRVSSLQEGREQVGEGASILGVEFEVYCGGDFGGSGAV